MVISIFKAVLGLLHIPFYIKVFSGMLGWCVLRSTQTGKLYLSLALHMKQRGINEFTFRVRELFRGTTPLQNSARVIGATGENLQQNDPFNFPLNFQYNLLQQS